MAEINSSIGVDKRFWREDIAASKAHAAMLGAQGIVSEEDAERMRAGSTRLRPNMKPRRS
jgi:argininosuccinate lyase